jgi:hypothetical protein
MKSLHLKNASGHYFEPQRRQIVGFAFDYVAPVDDIRGTYLSYAVNEFDAQNGHRGLPIVATGFVASPDSFGTYIARQRLCTLLEVGRSTYGITHINRRAIRALHDQGDTMIVQLLGGQTIELLSKSPELPLRAVGQYVTSSE